MAVSFLYAHQATQLPYNDRVASKSYFQQETAYMEPTQSFGGSSSNSSTSTLRPVFAHPQTLQPLNHRANHLLSSSSDQLNHGWQTRSSSLPLPLAGPSMMHNTATTAPHPLWIPQSNIHSGHYAYPDLYNAHPTAASRTKSWPAPQHHYPQPSNQVHGWQGAVGSKSHTRSSSSEWKAHKRSSSNQVYSSGSGSGSPSPLNGRTSPARSPSSSTHSRSSSAGFGFSSPPNSPFPDTEIPSSASSSGNTSASGNGGGFGSLTPVHEMYAGLARTESGLIPIPHRHAFTRGEIVMTRTTRRLMKTSSTSRLTARHPCLILEVSPTQTHVRVLQMTSHVNLTEDQVRVVGAKLRHWLAREDEGHQDAFGRLGLQTCPPSNRAGYIWVGDGGEWVPIESVKYLTGTRVDEGEVRRLESLIAEHEMYIPFRPSSDGGK